MGAMQHVQQLPLLPMPSAHTKHSNLGSWAECKHRSREKHIMPYQFHMCELLPASLCSTVLYAVLR